MNITYDYLTKEEVDEVFSKQDYQLVGEEDEYVIIRAERDMPPRDRTKAVIAYLNAMGEFGEDDARRDAALKTIIEGVPQHIQLKWGEYEGDRTWKFITESEGEFNRSKFTFWVFILETGA